MMIVGQHMTHQVLTVGPRTTYREARDLMKEKRIRRLPVLDGSRLVGIVSEKDLLSTGPSAATTLSIYEIYTLLDSLKVSQFMKHPVITVGPDCPLQDAAQIMIEHKIGCLPVMRTQDLIGIITETDIMRILVNVLGGGSAGIHFAVRLKDEPGSLAAVCAGVAKAGGNIVSIVSEANEPIVSIKERGANMDQLQANIREAGGEFILLQDGKPHIPQHFG